MNTDLNHTDEALVLLALLNHASCKAASLPCRGPLFKLLEEFKEWGWISQDGDHFQITNEGRKVAAKYLDTR